MRALVRFAALLLHDILAFFPSREDQAIVELALRQQLSVYAQEKGGDPGAVRTRDPQLRRLFVESLNRLILIRHSEILVRSCHAMKCQEMP